MPAEVEALGRVEPIYEVHPGWQQPTGAARRLADLPLRHGRIWTAGGAFRGAGALCERRDPAGSDHRSMTGVNGE